ncbi:MAG TPA: IS1380 family transposase [Streptosporangiaceae bacterium]|nr:IS1380 family transposase [Streptosporangiaceae bacterium]
MQDTRWHHGLKVTGEGEGLIGHAGAVLLRKLADQAGLTGALGPALARAGKSPLAGRGIALVSMAVAIVLGATSMNDITLLAHHAPVLGAEPSDTTVRRTLELADPRTLDKVARVRAAVRAHVWSLICATPAGFPWLVIAGKLLAGWLVIDLDATLITACSDKEGAAPTFKMGYGFHPLGAWLANTAESLAMLLRPGNAGSNTFADHLAVLTAALRQIPSRMRSRLLVRVDGAGASHELITHLLSLSSRRRTVLFTSGWMITAADEEAIRLLPATAWQTTVDQDGAVQEDKHVAEISHLLSRAGRWPAGLRWIVRRTRPSRRQARNLTAYERATGWRYSIICTNIPAARGIPGVPGSHHAQFIDVLHRQHAIVEDGVRTGKSMGLHNLPSKTWVVNCGWVLAANLAADLAAWCRLLGLYDQEDLKDAEPDTLRYRLLSLPARLVRHARQRVLKISRTWPWKEAFLVCWQRLCALPAPA